MFNNMSQPTGYANAQYGWNVMPSGKEKPANCVNMASEFRATYPVDRPATLTQHVDVSLQNGPYNSMVRHQWPSGQDSPWQRELRNGPDVKIVNIEELSNVWEQENGGDDNDPVFQCTFNRFPQTNSLLSKSRLPLGIIVQPFAKTNPELPLVKRDYIIRCKSCRTYLNPFVSIVRRYQWRCNVCQYLNEVSPSIAGGFGDDQQPCVELQHRTYELFASSDYMIRPPVPAVYTYLLEVSHSAVSSGYLKLLCDRMIENIDKIPSDSRTLISLICYDEHLHYFIMDAASKQFKRAIVTDLTEFFLPSPASSLLVKLQKRKAELIGLLRRIPDMFSPDDDERHSQSCLGYALHCAILMIKPTGGRITAFVCQAPGCGPGSLDVSGKTKPFNLSTDFYKETALECSEVHITVDMFVLSSAKTDLFTLYSLPKNCAGEMNYIWNFSADSPAMAEKFIRRIDRYLSRPVGFEAVMRVRCTKGISLFTFHGSCFVRTSDLVALPVVNADAAYGIELQIDEELNRDVEFVYIQTAVLYTNHMAQRRIRVHTASLPVTKSINELYQSANLKAVVCLVSRMAAAKAISDSRELARAGMTNVALDVVKAFSTLVYAHQPSNPASLYLPTSVCALPACMLALMSSVGFNSDPSITEDQRTFFLCQCNTLPIGDLMRLVYPPLYDFVDILRLVTSVPPEQKNAFQFSKKLPLSAQSFATTGLYVLHTYDVLYVYARYELHATIVNSLFGVQTLNDIPLDTTGQFQGNNWIAFTMASFLQYLCHDLIIQPLLLIIRDKEATSSVRKEIQPYLYDDQSPNKSSLQEFYKYIKSKF